MLKAPRACPTPGPTQAHRRRLTSAWFAWAAAALASFACDCPREYVASTWLTDEGLPHNVVNRIRQDGKGYVWLGTAAGLARFDGFEFETFSLPAAYSRGGYALRDLAVVNGSTLLLLPPLAGLVQFTDGQFSLHPITDHVEGKIADIYAEPTGVVWASTYEGVLTRWEPGRVETFGAAAGIGRRGLGFFFARDGQGRTWISAADFLGYYQDGRLVRYTAPLGTMLQITAARDGGLWVLADGHLFKLKDGATQLVQANPPWLALKTSVRCFHEDVGGVLWIGTARHGVFRYHCGIVEDTGLFPHQGIQSILEDDEGNIWIATDGGGMGRVRPKALRVYDHTAGLPESLSTSVCEDENGDLWFANRAGGLVRKRGNELQVFPYRDAKSPIFVSAICPDRQGYLWVSATIGVYRVSLQDPATLIRVQTNMRNPRVLYCNRRGEIWAGTSGDLLGYFKDGAFHEIKRDHGFLGEGVTAITEDKQGHMWCGGATGELYRWHDGRMSRFDTKDGIPPSPIHSLYADNDGSLWIGSLAGLLVRDEKGFHAFTTAQGLPDGMVLQIQEDDRGRLWLGGSGGLFHVNKRELIDVRHGRINRVHAVTHGKDEGLPGMSPTTDYQPSTWRDHTGRMWFTSYRGVLAVDPLAVVSNTKPPPVMIKHALVDDRPLNLQGPVEIPPGPHQLEFSFAALSYTAPAKVRLRHRLEGVDPHWVETTAARSARYSNLPPGSYQLHVIACNNDGVWNEKGATFAFVVRPAWWQTGSFLFACFTVFTGAVVWGARSWTQRRFRRRVELLERENSLERERARIARDLHDELGASITGIGMLANRLRASGPEDAAPVIEQLAGRTQRLASDLERVVWTVSPKNNSLDRLAVFLGRFAQNFFRDTGVVCLVRGPRYVPPLPITPDVQHHVLAVAKEAINNALKHAHATQVIVESVLTKTYFSITIRDNGVGFLPVAMEQSDRNGLSNMRSRMAEIHGELHIESEPGQGCAIVIHVPLSAANSPPRNDRQLHHSSSAR